MSATELMLIDDTDPGISYSGSWTADKGSVDNLGNWGAPYMSTSHYTKGTGSFTYTFSGSYIGVFGTTVDNNDPVRECTVDGVKIPNNHLSSAENLFMHCQVGGLSDGRHTLVVTVPTANPSGYWFDHIAYIPSASVSRTDAVMLFENGDSSLQYGSGWSQKGPGYTATVNGATMTMQFTGRSLTWLGYYLSENPFAPTTATWSIDGGTPMSFNLNGSKSQSTGIEFNQRFFMTGVLPAGQHTLKVVYNGNGNTTPLTVYNIVVQNGAFAGISVGGSIGSSTPVTATGTSANTLITTPAVDTPGSTPAPQLSMVTVIGTGASAVTLTVATNSTVTQGAKGASSTAESSISSGNNTLDGSTPSVPGSGAGTSGPSGTAVDGSAVTTGSGMASTGPKFHHTIIITSAIVGSIGLLVLFFLAAWILRRKHNARRHTIPPPSAITAVQPFTDPPSSATTVPAHMTDESSPTQDAPFVPPGILYGNEKQQLVGLNSVQSPSLPVFALPLIATSPDSDDVMRTSQTSGLPVRPISTVTDVSPPTYSA